MPIPSLMVSAKNREIERLRGIAIIMTMICHAPSEFNFNRLLTSGWTGVDLFFVISGMVVTSSLFRALSHLEGRNFIARLKSSEKQIKAFYVRRIYRLLPVAIVGVALPFLFTLIWGEFGYDSLKSQIREIAAIFSGIHNYAMGYGAPRRHAVYWSLMVEEHFYLLVPLFLVAVTSQSHRLVICLIGIALVTFVFRPLSLPPVIDPTQQAYYLKMVSHRRFDVLLVGVALAIFRSEKILTNTDLNKKIASWVLVPFFITMIWAIPGLMLHPYLPGSYRHDFAHTPVAFFAGFLVWIASLEKGYVFESKWLSTPLEFLGARCYTLYLMHFFLFRFYSSVLSRTPFFLNFKSSQFWVPIHLALVVTLVLVVSEAVHQWIEKPLLLKGHKRADEILKDSPILRQAA